MILGPLEDQRMREDGVVVYFRPLKSEEKLLFMKRLLEEQTLRMIEVVFPFPVLHPESRQELSCPCDGWQISETLAEQLEEGEVSQNLPPPVPLVMCVRLSSSSSSSSSSSFPAVYFYAWLRVILCLLYILLAHWFLLI